MTKGNSSPHGPYFNWKTEDGSLDGNYIEHFEWHSDRRDHSKSATDINTFLSENASETYLYDIEGFEDEEILDGVGKEVKSFVIFVPKEHHHMPEVIAAKQKELNHFIDYKG